MTATLPQLWLLDLRAYQETSRWRTLLPGLPPERQRRALACRWEIDGARLACAGFLLQQTLASAGIPISDQVFTKNEWGKPRLVSNAVDFSLSHAGNFCVCALDSSPLGVDVELPRISMAVAARCFHPDEAAFLQTLPEEAQKDALLRLWTAKESYLKYLGRGLRVPLDSFCVRLDENGASRRRRRVFRPSPARIHARRLPHRLCTKAPARRFNSINRNKAAAGITLLRRLF